MIRKIYRQRVTSKWEIIEKETVDEIIFGTAKTRNRLMLELMTMDRSGHEPFSNLEMVTGPAR
jgi:hypothetical protein